MTDTKPKHVFEIYIRTTPEKLWQAITDPAFTKQYFFGASVESDWKSGSPYVNRAPGGGVYHGGKILESDPPTRLVQTFEAGPDCSTEHGDVHSDPPSRVTWLIEPRGEAVKLTLIHDGFESETPTYKSVGNGWSPILSGLKTLLETGKALHIDGL